MKNTIAVIDDPLFGEHRAPSGHPERPERLLAARKGLEEARLSGSRSPLAPRDASDEELGRVHEDSYLEVLAQATGRSGYFDPDTYFGPQSTAAARRAAGGAIAMSRALQDGNASYGVALLRPPGHHARPGSAMGFCLLNNVAIAAADARHRGAERVAIVDWDVHHGNGTQEIFYRDPSVLYVSVHQFPFYPGTGATTEVGEADGAGFTVNVPLSAGATDAVYAAAVDRLIAPILSEFDPDLLLVSAGFDAHARDPLAGMQLSDAGYARMLRALVRGLPRGVAGRLGFVLEGGYDLVGLETSLRAVLEALDPEAQAELPAIRGEIGAQHEGELEKAIRVQTAYWQLD